MNSHPLRAQAPLRSGPLSPALPAGMAVSIDPALLLVPAVLAVSCSFTFLIGTTSNTIAFGSG